MKPWWKSSTIHGLIVSAVALALGVFLPASNAKELAPGVTEWVLRAVELGGLAYAARGRARATGPLS